MTPTADHANNDKVLVAMTLFIQDAKGYYAHKIYQVLWVCVVFMLLFGTGPGLEKIHSIAATMICVLTFFLLCYVIIDKPIWQVDLVDGQTLQFRTSRTVDSINVTAVTRLVLTKVDDWVHPGYQTKVIAEGRAWKWNSTEIDAMRFVDAMLAINPQIPIDRCVAD